MLQSVAIPPGTGKTHTIRYLLSQMRELTAFVMSGQALGLIGQACGLARLLQPSLVILEDVDLVAGDRSFGPVGGNPLLFEVLNQIDGLGDDVNVTFLLTTNRVDILERALAERPGRVDAAVEIGMPDAAGRAQLLRLYGKALGVSDLTDEDLADALDATEGRTASYLREVVRRAALADAARHSGPLRVDGPALAAAARSLLGDASALTRALLGGGIDPSLTGSGDTTAGGAIPADEPQRLGYQTMQGTSMAPARLTQARRGLNYPVSAPPGEPPPFGPDF
ncbi:ATP-binding protein [Acidiferrimicrobium sp. IK]|uniref:AAA family ATPase n=1 Tax=Acidiferrimicrobium sp. IK TaxID=2871700 RepID=UPI0021CB5671|nr:ATP-binding protein [Acidiferrimicrobium sp. IK]MCU4184574.1 ATP-binding protein [Acidiferrimicrobium sp. IK]